LLKETLGKDFYYNNDKMLITQKTEKGGISQAKANMHGKRAIIYGEPGKHETLNCATLKEFTGCPELSGRGLYSKNTTIKNIGTTIIHTNTIPPLDYVDDAIANRLIVVPFRSLFRTEEKIAEYPEGTPHLHLANTYYKSKEFLIDNRLTFMNILIKYFKDFKADGYQIKNIPETMKKLADTYMSESDDFINWFYEKYETTDDESDIIKMKDVFSEYRGSDLYQNLTKKEKRKNTKKNMILYVSKHPTLRPYYRERYRKENKNCRNVFLKHRLKQIDDDSDSDAEEFIPVV